MIPAAYRSLLEDGRTRRLLAGLGASSLGDGLSTITIAWLAVSIAPAGDVGPFVGLAVGSLGASMTLAISGLATLVLAAVATVLWTSERADAPESTS